MPLKVHRIMRPSAGGWEPVGGEPLPMLVLPQEP